MKQYHTLLTLLMGLFLLTSCGDNNQPEVIPGENVELDYSSPIALGGTLETSASLTTRGNGPVTGTTPSSKLALKIYRADMPSAGTYGTTYSELGADMETSGDITFATTQYYLSNPALKTNLIGVYPAGTYTSGTVTYSNFNGTDDIMCSTLIEGSRGSTGALAMPFQHMLTQVQVKILATDTDAITAWGNVTGISIAGKKIDCVVTLPTPAASPGAATITAVTGTATALPLTQSNGTATTSTALTTTATAYGCAMFLPITTAEALTFNITTANGGNTAQTLTMTTGQTFAAGTAYEMTITFTRKGIDVEATITDWQTGNTITGTI